MAIAACADMQIAPAPPAADTLLVTLSRWAKLLGPRPGSLRDWLLADRERSSLCVAHERDHDLWIVRWPPGAIAHPHAHHAAIAAAVVVEGTLVERARRGGRWVSSGWSEGRIELQPRGFLHQLANRSDRVAYSLHLHAPGLSQPHEGAFAGRSSGRRLRAGLCL